MKSQSGHFIIRNVAQINESPISFAAAFVHAATGCALPRFVTRTFFLPRRPRPTSPPNTTTAMTNITNTETSTETRLLQVPPNFQSFWIFFESFSIVFESFSILFRFFFDFAIYPYSFFFATTKTMNELQTYKALNVLVLLLLPLFSIYIVLGPSDVLGWNVCRIYSFTFILIRC